MRHELPVFKAQLGKYELVNCLRIGLAARGFHHLTDKPAGHFRLFFGLLNLFGIGGNHLINCCFNGAGIGYLFQAFFLDNISRIAPLVGALVKHQVKNILGDTAGYRLV